MITRFGPAGTADSFKAMGYKKTVQLAEYLEKFGLNALNTNVDGVSVSMLKRSLSWEFCAGTRISPCRCMRLIIFPFPR